MTQPASLSVAVHFGDPQWDLCGKCQHFTAYVVSVQTLTCSGVGPLGTMRRCVECDS